MKNIVIYLTIFCSFLLADEFPTFDFDLNQAYKEFKSVNSYKKKSDLIAEKWGTKAYQKKLLNYRGLRGFFIGMQYWYGKQNTYFEGASYKRDWKLDNQENAPQSQQALSVKLGYIFLGLQMIILILIILNPQISR